MPESCGDVNACVGAGPVDLGTYQTCNPLGYTCDNGPVIEPPCGAQGTQSEWFTVQYLDSCSGPSTLYIDLESYNAALFDVFVYEDPSADAGEGASTCPELVASAVSTASDSGPTTQAFAQVSTPGQLYIHVVAQSATLCSTSLGWNFGFAE